ncbi:MAG: ferrochelatase [Bryobacteraceae bacterium]|nr:ferrochelatase [Bryobacteraceae bacterium]
MSDAILIVSFGGPDGPDDVLPFLENVLRGRNVPRERLLEVAEHYHHFDGRSPINDQNRALIAALQELLDREGPRLPIYWGNRNWHPLLPDTFARMKEDGVTRALCFVTSAYSSYSGCRQYRENLAAANGTLGLETLKLRVFYNHPGFIEPMVEQTKAALAAAPGATLLFTAHSVPMSMAATSDYVKQLTEASRLVAEGAGCADYRLVYQSRSGPPTQPWLEPDICDAIATAASEGAQHVVVMPVGFISDHLEVLYDLDTEARQKAADLGIGFTRVPSVGTDPRFIAMIRELILERLDPGQPKRACGLYGPNHDVCPIDCCPAPPARRT